MAAAIPCHCDAPHRRRFRRTRNPASRDTKSAFGLTRKFQVPHQLAHCRERFFSIDCRYRPHVGCMSKEVAVRQPLAFLCRPRSGLFVSRRNGGHSCPATAGDAPQGWGGHMAAGWELVHHAAAMVAPQVVADDTQHSRLSWLRVAPFLSRTLREMLFKHHPQSCTKSQKKRRPLQKNA